MKDELGRIEFEGVVVVVRYKTVSRSS